MSSTLHHGGAVRRLHLLLRSNWITATGAVAMVLSALALATISALEATGYWGGPYVGIITGIALPIVFIGGLGMVPFGLLLYRKRLNDRLARLADQPTSMARAVVLLTLINFVAVASLGYGGASYMGSTRFCGTACHEAMQPEYVTYVDSPHCRVECVDCHVGPGAESFLRSKLNGVKQLVSYLRDDYARPIPVPVAHLRSAKETCENCHWPEKYLGTKLLVKPHFREDEAVSSYVNVLLMRTGGKRPDGKVVGIHWHTHPDSVVEYFAADDKRTKIPWVRVRKPDGTTNTFVADGQAFEAPADAAIRQMDCQDCHNRSAHAFEMPGEALDTALANGVIPRKLPGIKRHAMDALQRSWTRAGAGDGIRNVVQSAYASSGRLDEPTRQLLEPAIAATIAIWERNVYPDRGVDWGTYPSWSNHAGCFRCHDGSHRDRQGKAITHDCAACHVVLSEEEEDPAILDSLGLSGR